jgi:hypothetical protein
MHQLKWFEREKKIARTVFEAALQQELAEVMAQFKTKAERVQNPDDLWAMEGWLAQQRRNVDEKYDFRYSELILLFGRLLREGRITWPQLDGLAQDKLAFIDSVVSLCRCELRHSVAAVLAGAMQPPPLVRLLRPQPPDALQAVSAFAVSERAVLCHFRCGFCQGGRAGCTADQCGVTVFVFWDFLNYVHCFCS